MLPAIPNLSFGAVDITSELFGDWKSPLPMDIAIIYRTMEEIEDRSFSVDIKNRPILVISNPNNVNISEPILSDILPLIGATMDKTNG